MEAAAEERDAKEFYGERAAELRAKPKEDVLALCYVWVMPASSDEPSRLVSMAPRVPDADAELLARAFPGGEAPPALTRVPSGITDSLRIHAAGPGDAPAGQFVLSVLGAEGTAELTADEPMSHKGPVVVSTVGGSGLDAEQIAALDAAHLWALEHLGRTSIGCLFFGFFDNHCSLKKAFSGPE